MKKYILLVVVSFYLANTSAQTSKPLVNSFGFHYSRNSTDYQRGFDLNFIKRKKVHKFYDLYYGATLTYHFGRDRNYKSNTSYFMNVPANALADYSPLKFQTFGIQIETGLTAKFAEKSFPIHLSASPILRYQATTLPFHYYFRYNPPSVPIPYYILGNEQPNTLSLGYKLQTEFGLFKVRSSKMFLNIYLQNDTNRDWIYGAGFVFKSIIL